MNKYQRGFGLIFMMFWFKAGGRPYLYKDTKCLINYCHKWIDERGYEELERFFETDIFIWASMECHEVLLVYPDEWP
jgi:hypothetical protein